MNVLIYGAGLLGRQVWHYARQIVQGRILGFVDDHKPAGESVVDNLATVGSFRQIVNRPEFSPQEVQLVLAIGYEHMQDRRRIYEMAKYRGYDFASIVHLRAHLEPGVEIGEGCVILPGTLCDQRVCMGPINFIDMGVIVCENCEIGSNNFIAAGSTLGGNIRMGNHNFVGLDTTCVDGIQIGNCNFINAKSLVHRSIGDNQRVIEFHEMVVHPRE